MGEIEAGRSPGSRSGSRSGANGGGRSRELTPGRLGSVVARHRAELVRTLRCKLKRLRCADLDPEDALGDAILLALRKLDRLGGCGERGILLWILRAAEHEAQNRIRVRARRRCLSLDAPDARRVSSPRRSPLEATLSAELRALVRETRAKLRPRHYLVIQLRDFEGRSWNATARLLGGRTVHATQELHRRAVGSLGRHLTRRIAQVRPVEHVGPVRNVRRAGATRRVQP